MFLVMIYVLCVFVRNLRHVKLKNIKTKILDQQTSVLNIEYC